MAPLTGGGGAGGGAPGGGRAARPARNAARTAGSTGSGVNSLSGKEECMYESVGTQGEPVRKQVPLMLRWVPGVVDRGN